MRFLRPTLLGQPLRRAARRRPTWSGPYYYYSLALLVLAAALMWRIVHSPFGLCLRTVRDNPLKAESLGLSVPRYRWYAFVISAVYAAVGGVLLAVPTGNVDPTLAYWTHSGNLVFMTLLGGFASFFGPIAGAPRLHLPPGHRDVDLPLLAARLRRHPRRARHLRPDGPRGPGGRRRPAEAATPVILEARDVTALLRRLLRAGRRHARRRDRPVRLDHRSERRRQVDPDQRADRAAPSRAAAPCASRDATSRGAGPVRLARLGLARSFQLVQIFPELTVLETLQAAAVSRLGRGRRLLGSLAADGEVRRDAEHVAELFGLGEKLHAPSRTLPAGRQEAPRRRRRVRPPARGDPPRRAHQRRVDPRQDRRDADARPGLARHRRPGDPPRRARHGHRLRLLRPDRRAPAGSDPRRHDARRAARRRGRAGGHGRPPPGAPGGADSPAAPGGA